MGARRAFVFIAMTATAACALWAPPAAAAPPGKIDLERSELREDLVDRRSLKRARPGERMQLREDSANGSKSSTEPDRTTQRGDSPAQSGARVDPATVFSDRQVVIRGAPPVPELTAPGASASIHDPCLQFRWQAGSGTTPADTTYHVEVFEDGAASQGAPERFPPAAGSAQTRLQACLPGGFQGAVLRWRVRACAPDPNARSIGGATPTRCSSSRTRRLRFELPTPELDQPAAGGEVDLRPRLSIRRNILGADYTLFCIARPGASCTSTPTPLSAQQAVVQQVSGRQFQPGGDLTQFAGEALHWTASVCNASVGCSAWAAPRAIHFAGFAPAPDLIGTLNFNYAAGPIHTFGWSVPSTRHVDSYKFCITSQNGSCDPSQAIAVWNTSNPRYQLNLRQHGGLAAYAGQTLKWTAAACNALGCSWQESRTGTFLFPPPPMQPTWIGPLPGTYVPRYHIPVTLEWNAALAADYYVPCLRDPSGQCGWDNEIFNPRVNGGATRCTVRGPYPSGLKIAQVAACNEVWGCVWSAPQPSPNIVFNPAGSYAGSETQLGCR